MGNRISDRQMTADTRLTMLAHTAEPGSSSADAYFRTPRVAGDDRKAFAYRGLRLCLTVRFQPQREGACLERKWRRCGCFVLFWKGL